MLSIVNAVKDIERARKITQVLLRHGFGEIAHRTRLIELLPSRKNADEVETPKIHFAERLRLVLQDLGPSFIKLGQVISTRPDLIPADIILELKKLQDDVLPVPYEEIQQTIENTLGASLEELFIRFDPSPLASASIGQVHRARIHTSEEGDVEVAVKVQRAGLRETIERDLDLLYFFAHLIERTVPESRIYSPIGLVREFDNAIMAELDFTVEADNAERFSANFAGHTDIRFPKPYREFSGRKVLTQEFFDGHKLEAAQAAGYSGERIAKISLRVMAQMIYEDGFFHADPHPGNLMILGTPKRPVVGMLDLGLVGRLNTVLREKIVDLMVAAVREDKDALADALLSIGTARGRIDVEAYRTEVAVLSEKYLGKSIDEIEVSGLIRDLVQGAIKYNIEMPTDMLMMGKALMTVEGVGKQIYPELDVYTELRPYLLRLFWQRYHPQRLTRDVLRTLGQVKDMAVNLPSQLHTILDDLRAGRLEVHTVDPQRATVLDALGRRLFTTVMVAALTLSGTLLLASARQEALGWVLISLAGAQVIGHALGARRRQRQIG